DTWMRRQAVDILKMMGTPGPNDIYLNALVGLISDVSVPVKLRSAAAGALNHIDLIGLTQSNISKILFALGNLLVDGCTEQIEVFNQGRVPPEEYLMAVIVSIQSALGTPTAKPPPVAPDAEKGEPAAAPVNSTAGGLRSVAKKANIQLIAELTKITSEVQSTLQKKAALKLPELNRVISKTDRFLDKVEQAMKSAGAGTAARAPKRVAEETTDS
ncbi:MAG: hypothetical protein N2C12_10560, partial [Planctomycetales bacterium]